jgi:hypothetical protein
MNDKQAFAVLIGSLISALVGGLLLLAAIQLVVVYVFGGHIDAGDDGWGLIWLVLTVLSAIAGFTLSTKWARKRYGDYSA